LRLKDALGDALDSRQKPIVSERPADTFGGAQAREGLKFLVIRFGREEVRKARDAFANGRTRRDAIVLAGEMGARA
jgi:hypothetical protein